MPEYVDGMTFRVLGSLLPACREYKCCALILQLSHCAVRFAAHPLRLLQDLQDICLRSNITTMSGKKIITVFGATGSQGGSVVDIFLADPKLKSDWSVRAVTRDTTKDSAKKLQSRGAEVVNVSHHRPPSVPPPCRGRAKP